MKKILITGLNSYVGNSLGKWLENYPDKYSVNFISLRDNKWKERDFSGFDVVCHVAGIAHIKETKGNAAIYFKINRDLAYDVAKKAKNEGIKQFIFLSSMSVYGLDTGVISQNTIPAPKSNYGKSKLEAEKLLKTLADHSMNISIIRPPMIYGKGCKGNYKRLAKLASKTPFFPNIQNNRSMIYIDNLCEFITFLIDNVSEGFFFPQNKDYVCTSELVKFVAEIHGKDILLTKLFNPLLTFLKTGTVSKVFGDLVYDKELSKYKRSYQSRDFRDSIIVTEGKKKE